MSGRYVVRIVGPSGRETYLAPTYVSTWETDDFGKANHFASESCALLCADLYRKAHIDVPIAVDVIDVESGEVIA